jgi:enoyl-CoA hydratase/carnithine racemase
MDTEERYAKYTWLRFDWPHPNVIRIMMSNGKMNSADQAMHRDLVELWGEIDREPKVNSAIITGAGAMFSVGGDFGGDS